MRSSTHAPLTLNPAPTHVVDGRRRRSPRVATLAVIAALLIPLCAGMSSAQARTSTERSYAAAVLTLMNQERRANHLSPLRSNGHLVTSARRHNLAMVRTDTLTHQAAGETGLAQRFTRAKYRYTTGGENVGYNVQMTRAGVLELQQEMYDERPPGEVGHRANILNRTFRDAGVDVYLDSRHHKVWLTVDLGSTR